MFNPPILALTLIALAYPLRAKDDLYKQSIASVLAKYSPSSGDRDQIILMEIPGFPGKPVELAYLVRIIRHHKNRTLRVTYWTIPATTREPEDLEHFLKIGIKNGFSNFPNSTFTIRHYPQYVDDCFLATSDLAGSQRRGLDIPTRIIGIKRINDYFADYEGLYTKHEYIDNLFKQLDSWLSPHRKKLHADVIRRLFQDNYK